MLTFVRSEPLIDGMFMKPWQTMRTLLLMWIVIWLLAVPLFHVHPDAAHHHNESGPHHGGIAHTVFSRDLDGEFGNRKVDFQEPKGLVTHSTPSSQDSPELDFSLLSDASGRKILKSLLAPVSLIPVAALSTPETDDRAVQNKNPLRPLLLVFELSSRAPPLVLL